MQDKPATSPRVSLSLPVRNGERYLSQAIQSILDQTYADFEIIITDNASTDATEDISREYAHRDPRIRYVRSPQDQGAAANFNLGFSLSSGEYFKWCAHDDLISRNFVSACVSALDQSDQAVTAYGRQQGIDEEGQPISWNSCDAVNLMDIPPAVRFARVFPVQGFDTAIFGLHRRDALSKSLLHATYYGSDIALLAELALLGSFVRLEHAIFFNRQHPNRSINMASKRHRQLWQCPQAEGGFALEHLQLYRYLFSIALRHRRTAPLLQTVPRLLAWGLSPRQLARYTLEIIGTISPTLQHRLRRRGAHALHQLRRASER